MVRQMEKGREKKYIAEAQMVYRAMELYVEDYVSEESMMEFYANISMYSFDDDKNVMHEILKGLCSEGAKVKRLSMNREEVSLTAIVYSAGGYEIEIRNGRLDECKKVNGS